MRKTIQFMLEKMNLPVGFDQLRTDERVALAAVANDVSIDIMALEILKKQEAKNKPKPKPKQGNEKK